MMYQINQSNGGKTLLPTTPNYSSKKSRTTCNKRRRHRMVVWNLVQKSVQQGYNGEGNVCGCISSSHWQKPPKYRYPHLSYGTCATIGLASIHGTSP